ncbi:SRPBCC family protein [uncultured Cetobacterium sp.]|uniref:SRPBCC family protein n=1 Tax=uncultured Cetobacterium sp. TaxID=527638 RepID=UPI002611BF6C|nr:SRPBCC family protein [uncultured Cetobacterium sp.]
MELKVINEKKPFFVEGIDIDAPKDFVFKFISEYEKHGLWIQGLKNETHTDVDGVVGSTFTETLKLYGLEEEYCGKVLSYEVGKMYQIEIGDKWVDFKIEYDFDEIAPEKTHLIQTAWTIKGTGLHKLFNFFNRQILHKQMEKLKASAEAEYKKVK